MMMTLKETLTLSTGVEVSFTVGSGPCCKNVFRVNFFDGKADRNLQVQSVSIAPKDFLEALNQMPVPAEDDGRSWLKLIANAKPYGQSLAILLKKKDAESFVEFGRKVLASRGHAL